MDKIKKTSKKPALSVPSTDLSQKDDRYTKQFIFYCIVACVVIVLAGGGLLYWLVGRYINQSNKNKAQDKTISLLQKKKTDLEALKPNYEKITASNGGQKSDADYILDAMPTDDGFKQLITIIERIGEESGAKVSSTTKDSGGAAVSSAAASNASAYKVTVSLQGDFNNILEFLRRTEKSSRVMNFVSMSLSGSTSSGDVTATITFSVYYKGPADIAPKTKELK